VYVTVVESIHTHLVLAYRGVVSLGTQADAAVIGSNEQLGVAVLVLLVPVPRVLVIFIEPVLPAILRFATFILEK